MLTRDRIRWLLLPLALALSAAPSSAGEGRLEMSLRSDQDRRPFLFQAPLSSSNADEFSRGSNRVIHEFLVQGQKAYAEKQGYREAVYGKDYWKIVRLQDWEWRVIDASSGRTVARGDKRGVVTQGIGGSL